MGKYSTTSEWKEINGLKGINVCIPIALLTELDRLCINRSEAIRLGIRMYIKQKKTQLTDMELESSNIHQHNVRKQVNTGLLPDY